MAIRGSAHHLDCVLLRWARLRRVSLGNGRGHAGWSLFAEPHEAEWMPPVLVIEHRGPGWPPVRIVFTYAERGRGNLYRQTAFEQSVRLLLAMRLA